MGPSQRAAMPSTEMSKGRGRGVTGKHDVGPRAGVFRAIVKPVYSWVNLTASAGIDRALRVRTTPRARNKEGIPVARAHRPWGWFQAVRLFRRYPLMQNDVLVDIGSGSGRVVLLAASLFHCRKAIGVERTQHLLTIAKRNLSDWRLPLRTKVEFVNADVLTWDLPADTTVVFCYNSMRGNDFRVLVDHLLRSVDRSPRRIRFLYANPSEAEYLTSIPRFSLIHVVRSWRPRPDWARTVSVHVYEVA